MCVCNGIAVCHVRVNVCSEESIFGGLFRTRHERAVVCDYCVCETNLCVRVRFVETNVCTQLTLRNNDKIRPRCFMFGDGIELKACKNI